MRIDRETGRLARSIEGEASRTDATSPASLGDRVIALARLAAAVHMSEVAERRAESRWDQPAPASDRSGGRDRA